MGHNSHLYYFLEVLQKSNPFTEHWMRINIFNLRIQFIPFNNGIRLKLILEKSSPTMQS